MEITTLPVAFLISHSPSISCPLLTSPTFSLALSLQFSTSLFHPNCMHEAGYTCPLLPLVSTWPRCPKALVAAPEAISLTSFSNVIWQATMLAQYHLLNIILIFCQKCSASLSRSHSHCGCLPYSRLPQPLLAICHY